MEDNKGFLALTTAAIIAIVVGASLTYIGFFVDTTVRTTITPTAATGTITFSGNVTNGELVNITYGSNIYRFEFNTTNGSTCLTANCIPVNLTGVESTGRWWNQSWYASGNLTAAINANASTAALVTAVNTTNVTTLTSVLSGTLGNSITLSDNVVNVATSGLSGGLGTETGTDAATRTNVSSNVNTAFILAGILIMLLGAAGLISVLFKGFVQQVGR